jgi:hypothetical protein
MSKLLISPCTSQNRTGLTVQLPSILTSNRIKRSRTQVDVVHSTPFHSISLNLRLEEEGRTPRKRLELLQLPTCRCPCSSCIVT